MKIFLECLGLNLNVCNFFYVTIHELFHWKKVLLVLPLSSHFALNYIWRWDICDPTIVKRSAQIWRINQKYWWLWFSGRFPRHFDNFIIIFRIEFSVLDVDLLFSIVTLMYWCRILIYILFQDPNQQRKRPNILTSSNTPKRFKTSNGFWKSSKLIMFTTLFWRLVDLMTVFINFFSVHFLWLSFSVDFFCDFLFRYFFCDFLFRLCFLYVPFMFHYCWIEKWFWLGY